MQPMILSRSKKKARTYVLAFLEFTSLDLLNVSSLPWLGVLSGSVKIYAQNCLQAPAE